MIKAKISRYDCKNLLRKDPIQFANYLNVKVYLRGNRAKNPQNVGKKIDKYKYSIELIKVIEFKATSPLNMLITGLHRQLNVMRMCVRRVYRPRMNTVDDFEECRLTN